MSPETSHEDHDALAERRSDQGVWNGAMGQAALDGFYPDKSKSKSHKPRPTGRHIVEPGGSDLSRIKANNDAINNPMTTEEKEKARRSVGHSSVLTFKAQLEFDRMMQRTEGDPQARAVALRKLADGKK